MDRFIATNLCKLAVVQSKFKIQYGQIYRIPTNTAIIPIPTFKIQYGQIYRKTADVLNLDVPDLKSNMDRFIAARF